MIIQLWLTEIDMVKNIEHHNFKFHNIMVVSDQINADLMIISDFFQKHYKE